MTAVAVMLLIVVLVILLMVVWSLYADEHARRVRADHEIARLTADLHKERSTARRAWTAPIPPRVHVPIVAPPDTQENPMPVPHRRLGRHRLAVFTAVIAVMLAAAAGCYPQPRALGPFSNPTPTATKVVVFGDSLGAWARQPALALWADHPDVSVSYNAVAGTQVADWIPAMGLIGGQHCVIWELGTNDISQLSSLQVEWNALAGLNELADADTVVAFTLNTTGGDLRGPPYAAATRHYNQFLRRTVTDGTYPNLVLFDWEAVSAGHIDWLNGPVPGGDVVHYNAEGNAQFAQALVDASGAC